MNKKPTMSHILRDVAAHMADAAQKMEWEADGRAEWIKHARELYGAAKLANEWAKEIERE